MSAAWHAGHQTGILDRQSSEPLHGQLARILRSDIAAQGLAAGTPLPSEAALCARFGVARSVVRQAIGALIASGEVVREAGQRATVAAARQHHRLVQRSIGLHEQLAREGVTLRTRVLHLAAQDPPQDVAQFLETRETLRLERLRSIDGHPLAFVTTWLPLAAMPGVRAQDLEDASLHRLLAERYGRYPGGGGRHQIRAVAADERLAGLLDVAIGSPLLMLSGHGLDRAGQPLEYFTTWHRPEQLVFDVEVSRDRESITPRVEGAGSGCDAAPPRDDAAVDHQDEAAMLARMQDLIREMDGLTARLRGLGSVRR